MGFGEAFRRCFTDSLKFALALPLVFLALVAVEGLQHVAEWNIGLYGSLVAFKQHANDAQRMAPGFLKVFLDFALTYWVARWAASGRNVRAAWRADPVAIRRFIPVVAIFFFGSVFALEGSGWLQAAGLAPKPAALVVSAIMLATYPLSIVILPWSVGATLGGEPTRLSEAPRLARGSILWSIGLSVAATLPPMIVHYALGYGAVGKPPGLAIPLLAVDAIVAGFLAVVIAFTEVLSVQRMLQRNGRTLQCDGGTFV